MPKEIIDFYMVEHFGGYSEWQNTPARVAEKHTLVWMARNSADAERNKRQEEEMERERRRVGG